MALVKDITRRLQVPHEPREWIEFRMPSWVRLEDAQRKRLIALGELGRAVATIEVSDAAIAAARADKAANANRVDDYDRHTLLWGGIVAWSYGDFSPELVDELDERTAMWAARELVALAFPGEEETKGPASPSTAS